MKILDTYPPPPPQSELVARVHDLVQQAKALDQTSEDRDPTVDSVQCLRDEPANWDGPDYLTRAKVTPQRARLTAASHQTPFYNSELHVDMKGSHVELHMHHPSDPQFFDYRASYNENPATGEVQNYRYESGPNHGFGLAREILTNPACELGIALTAVVGTGVGLLAGGAAGATAGGVIGAGIAFLYSMQVKAYGT